MFIALLFVIYYIALQSFHNTLRIRKITSALGSLSKAIAAAGNVPEKDQAEINAVWEKAKNSINEASAIMAITLVAICIFLIALGRQGHF